MSDGIFLFWSPEKCQTLPRLVQKITTNQIMVSMLYKLTDHLLSLQAPSWRGRGDPWRGGSASFPPSSASGWSNRPAALPCQEPHLMMMMLIFLEMT